MPERDLTIHDENAQASARTQGGHPVELLIYLLLVLGFFIGPLKLLGASWYSYLAVDAVALLVLFVVFAGRIAGRRPFFAASPISLPILLLAGFCVLELANPEAPFIRSVLGLRSWLFYLSFYFVGFYTLRSIAQLERVYALLLILGAITAAYGIYQWQAGPQAFANWSDYYGEYARLAWVAQSGLVFRAFSTFVAAGTFGGNMAFLMVLAFSVGISPTIQVKWRFLAGLAFAVMGVGIAASGSRGAAAHLLLTGAVALALNTGLRPRFAVVFKAILMSGVAIVFVFFLIGPIVSERFSTIFDPDTFFWKWFGPFVYGLQIAFQHPFGLGLGYTAGVPKFISDPAFQNLPATNIDSGYGAAAAELGFIGLGIFMWFAFKVGVEGFKAWWRIPAGRLKDLLFGPGLFAATYPISSIIFPPQATLPASIYFWLLIGMLFRAPTLHEEGHADRLHRSEMYHGE